MGENTVDIMRKRYLTNYLMIKNMKTIRGKCTTGWFS